MHVGIAYTRATATLRTLLTVLAFGVLGGASATPAAAGPVAVEPHRAVYDMSLVASRGSQAATSIGGLMEFTWRNVCDGWAIDYKSRMRVGFGQEGTRQLSWNYSSWESDDGTRFRFFLRRYAGGQEIKRARGKAELTLGEGGTAELSQPETRSIALPADTLFPKAHTEAIVRAARAGERFLWRHIFDGTGDHGGLFGVNAAILKDLPANQDLPMQHPLLRDVRSWRTSLAYFPAEGRTSTPESEQTMRLFANGVVGTLTIDYGDFVVVAELTELEALERPDCR